MATLTPRLGLSKPAGGDLVGNFGNTGVGTERTTYDLIDANILLDKGTYSGATAYVPGDVVVRNLIAYVCIANTTGNTPPNVTFWEEWAPTMSATVPVALGTASAGTAINPSAQDHVHPTTGLLTTGGSFATPAILLDSAAAAGAASTVIRSDSTIAAFDTTAPTTIQPNDAAAVGTATFAARRDHKHANVAAAPGNSAPGDVAAVGTSTSFPRADHVHGRESFATNAITLATAATAGSAGTLIRSDAAIAAFDATAPTTSAVGDAAATGSIAFAARRDHVHGRESFATPAIVLGSAAAAGAATTPIRSDSTIAAFDATNPSTSAVGDAAVVGTAAFAARRDHKHARESFATPAIVLGSAAAAGAATTLIRSDGTIAAFDTTAPTNSAPGDAAAVGTIAFAARRDHLHGRESATRFIRFDMYGGFAPDDGTGEKAARPSKVKSTGAVVTNSPTVYESFLLFDPSTDQHWIYQFMLPSNYSSGGTLRLKWGSAAATTGNVVWKASIAPVTDSSTETKALQWNTVTTSSATTVAGTNRQLVESTIALTTTGMSASRTCFLFIGRDADNGSDTMTDDAYLAAMILEYTGAS